MFEEVLVEHEKQLGRVRGEEDDREFHGLEREDEAARVFEKVDDEGGGRGDERVREEGTQGASVHECLHDAYAVRDSGVLHARRGRVEEHDDDVRRGV